MFALIVTWPLQSHEINEFDCFHMHKDEQMFCVSLECMCCEINSKQDNICEELFLVHNFERNKLQCVCLLFFCAIVFTGFSC